MRTHTHQTWDSQGNLVNSQVVAWTTDDYLQEIAMLEASITPRRLREAVLTVEGKAWLEAKELEIATLREEMP